MWNLAYAAMDQFGGAGMGVQAILESIATQVYDIENQTNAAAGATGGLAGGFQDVEGAAGDAADEARRLRLELENAQAIAMSRDLFSITSNDDGTSTIKTGHGSGINLVSAKKSSSNSNSSNSSSGSSKSTSSSKSSSKNSSYNDPNKWISYNPLPSTSRTKKSHSGEPFVEKIKTPWDEALGLSSNETLRILKVGERVIPAEQNIGNDKKLIERSTASKVSSMTSNTRNISNKNGSEDIIINMGDINIEGNATPDTVEALKKERESIIQGVFSRIEKHTKQSGFRNAKLFPIG